MKRNPWHAWRYVNAIRNAKKRDYAVAYLNHLTRGTRAPREADLSYMAAQAVRMRLAALVNESGYAKE